MDMLFPYTRGTNTRSFFHQYLALAVGALFHMLLLRKAARRAFRRITF